MYILDRATVLQKLYYLLCLFFANKEIARRSDPDDETAPLASLERKFFVAEASRTLIEIAIAVRVIDDQMKQLAPENTERHRYELSKAKIDRDHAYGLFDDLNLNLRETCNKIIHSHVMEPHSSEGSEAHELDHGHRFGDDERTIDWQHFNGFVRLCGADHKVKEWYVLLDLEVFVSAVYKLLSST
jgi:hypothetical protein